MATVRLSPVALADLERLAAEVIPLVFDSLSLLTAHPLVARQVAPSRRELVMFRGRSGYVAQYAFLPERDEVIVLTIRHQREAGH